MKELHLNLQSILEHREEWEDAGFVLPQYDIEKVRAHTKEHPHWLHFGAGNIFRAFPASIQDELLDKGETDTGVIIAETFQADKLDVIFTPYDNLSTAVTLKSNGEVDFRLVACIAETVKAEYSNAENWKRLQAIFTEQSLAVVSFTITEKGYSLKDSKGETQAWVKEEMQDSSLISKHTMGIVAHMLYQRFLAGKYPLTLVSMDNVSHNGDLLREGVLAYAKAWVENAFVEKEFYDYVSDPEIISFPWSMIDKITPLADDSVAQMLKEKGYMDVEGKTFEGRVQAPSFANAEETEYLVIEDSFRNGKPKWAHGGVIFADRETVDRVETMKVTTCLNPLHTALAVYGCLLGYDFIHEEMQDEDLVNLIKGISYKEGLPVVVNPGILDPKEFLDTVINVRFPNPFLPDTPWRIASDTSQKVGIRYGKTLSQYLLRDKEAAANLQFIPSALAGWLRYLLGVNDKGEEIPVSSDPMKESLMQELAGIRLGDNAQVEAVLRPILAREDIFAVDLEACGLVEPIIAIFKVLNQGEGAVRKYLSSLPRVENK